MARLVVFLMASRHRSLPPWIRLNQRFWLDEKLGELPIESRYLFVAICAHSAALGLDGRLPENTVKQLTVDFKLSPARTLGPIVDVGLVERAAPNQLWVPHWIKWQDTTEEQAGTRARKARNQRDKRKRETNGDEPLDEEDDVES